MQAADEVRPAEIRIRVACATAFPIRAPGFNVLVFSQWRDPAETERNVAWTRDSYRRPDAHAAPARYSNDMGDDEKPARVAEAYGVNFERLQALKNRQDPANFLRLDQNIPTAR